MLTAKNVEAHQAVDYFCSSFNYSDQVRWFGEGAKRLGLTEVINDEITFSNICRGLTADGSGKLGRNWKRAATDFTFSAPKSVSLSALVAGDERLITAHQESVEKVLAIMETQHAKTRIRDNYTRYLVKTANLIVAQFNHIESRELDPHLHSHTLVMNLTQTNNGSWYSLYNHGLFRNRKRLGAIYQKYLAYELLQLGYAVIERSHGQYEIAGYNNSDLITFSKRQQQILEKTSTGASWREKEKAWAITRKNKQKVGLEQLKSLWRYKANTLGVKLVTPHEELFQNIGMRM